MNFKKLLQHLSAHRFGRYLAAAANDAARAERMYKASLAVGAAFHPLLCVLEVVLRNGLNEVLSAHFSDRDWIVHQKLGFMSDPSLTYLDKRTGRPVTDDFLKASVDVAEKRLRRAGHTVTAGRVIAEQTLGFWTTLFDVKHYRLLRGRPIAVFKHLPTGHGRKEVADALASIRLFRNRLHHNEPICFSGSTFDLSYAETIHTAITDVLGWIDADLTGWVKDIDAVKSAIAQAKTV